MIQMSPASTSPKLTESGKKNVFRTCGRDDQQGQVAGAFLAETYKDGKVAILHDKSAYGKGLADETKAVMNAAGKKETLYEAYTAGDRDFSALVTKLKAEDIDAVYVGGYHTEAGLLRSEERRVGKEGCRTFRSRWAT